MANSEGSTVNVSSQLDSQPDMLAKQLDWNFAFQMAGCDTKGTNVPEITPHMLEQAQLIARICDLEIEFHRAPEGSRAKRAFAELVHSLFARAEARLTDCEQDLTYQHTMRF